MDGIEDNNTDKNQADNIIAIPPAKSTESAPASSIILNAPATCSPKTVDNINPDKTVLKTSQGLGIADSESSRLDAFFCRQQYEIEKLQAMVHTANQAKSAAELEAAKLKLEKEKLEEEKKELYKQTVLASVEKKLRDDKIASLVSNSDSDIRSTDSDEGKQGKKTERVLRKKRALKRKNVVKPKSKPTKFNLDYLERMLNENSKISARLMKELNGSDSDQSPHQEQEILNWNDKARKTFREELDNYERSRLARKEERRREREEREHEQRERDRNVSKNDPPKNNNPSKDNAEPPVNPTELLCKSLSFLEKDSASLKFCLTRTKNFKTWKNLLMTELGLKKLADVVDLDITPHLPFSQAEMKDRRRIVKGIILSHVDEMYQEPVLDFEDPKDIVNRLERMKREEVNDTSISVIDQLNRLKYDINKETLYDFNLKFDELVRKYELVTGEKMNDNFERDTYYRSIAHSIPSIKTATYTDRAKGTGDGFNLEELRRFAQQYESENKPLQGRGRGGGAMYARRNDTSQPWCKECGDYGHYPSQCPVPPGMKICYYCHKPATHVADDLSLIHI